MLYYSVYNDQTEIREAVKSLYLDGLNFHYDATFNTGGFWKDSDKPEICGDIIPRIPGCQYINVESTGFFAGTVRSVYYDPPFLIGADTIADKYGSYESAKEMFLHFDKALFEIHRILCNKGILLIKMQNLVHGGQRYFPTLYLSKKAQEYGLDLIDEFILVNSFVRQLPHKRSTSARCIHSYFLVLRKRSRSLRVLKY